MSRVKKSEKKASVERRVQRSSMVVKMNQPWQYCKQVAKRRSWKRLTDDQVKTKFVGESAGTRRRKLSFDVKATGGKNDGE